MQKGNIGVTSENIFPIIKKFLYSDREIFLRELVSNAVDATQKLKTLHETGDFKGELGDISVEVIINEKENTLTIRDKGIGMSEEEINKYINQIAFSGANDFLDKYKDSANNIIGHFGLGFYSAFMVSEEVEIVTKSHNENESAMRWKCKGDPSFEIEKTEKNTRGTDIILHIDEESKEYLNKNTIQELLNKYCKFMPIPVVFGKKTEWKDGKQIETNEDNVINTASPIWTKSPNTLKDEDYKEFYSTLYPMQDEPLFWIHLNVDYPFNLTGILYFPRIQSNIDLQKNKIQLYCNQVFVTDSVEGIVPEFLTLMHGVIDSPDIPLNVSRSYLQSDQNVKKISTYITKKVSDRLNQIFKENRKDYEEKWDNLKIFINYGMLSQEDFYNRAKDFYLLKDTENKCFTLEEYQTLIKENQTNKDGSLVYLYANNIEEQYAQIEAAKQKGYNVLLLDGDLDAPMVSMLEQKLEKTIFTRVDGDVIDNLIKKEDEQKSNLSATEHEVIEQVFSVRMPKIDNANFYVQAQPLSESAMPATITQSEYMRRMKDISKFQSGMGFYSQMPNAYNVVLNTNNDLIKDIITSQKNVSDTEIEPINNKIKELEAKLEEVRKTQKEGEPDSAEKTDLQTQIDEQQKNKKDIIQKLANNNDTINQIIDLSLLQSGMLKGGALTEFIQRSLNIIKKK